GYSGRASLLLVQRRTSVLEEYRQTVAGLAHARLEAKRRLIFLRCLCAITMLLERGAELKVGDGVTGAALRLAAEVLVAAVAARGDTAGAGDAELFLRLRLPPE